jgi:hypothetical protein
MIRTKEADELFYLGYNQAIEDVENKLETKSIECLNKYGEWWYKGITLKNYLKELKAKDLKK